MDKKTILVFGVGELQKSMILRAKAKGLFVVGIDPFIDAVGRNLVDAFEVVDGQDYEGTLAVARKYNISAVITAATDKPLVMMSRVAQELHLPFFSLQTAIWATDKSKMKDKFVEYHIPCAKGYLVSNVNDLSLLNLLYPVIVKPRDNSGSRGVLYCATLEEARKALNEALQYTKKKSVLVEEYIDGQEYSVESLHVNGKTYVLQITEKITTSFPYNVELGHIQPADLMEDVHEKIEEMISLIGLALNFENCASHTELKINERGIFIIETSPRLGGDFITSTLVPLSTGLNMEDLLLKISVGDKISLAELIPIYRKYSGIIYFELKSGLVQAILPLDKLAQLKGLQYYKLDIDIGHRIFPIINSTTRYGKAIFQEEDRTSLCSVLSVAKEIISRSVVIK